MKKQRHINFLGKYRFSLASIAKWNFLQEYSNRNNRRDHDLNHLYSDTTVGFFSLIFMTKISQCGHDGGRGVKDAKQ